MLPSTVKDVLRITSFATTIQTATTNLDEEIRSAVAKLVCVARILATATDVPLRKRRRLSMSLSKEVSVLRQLIMGEPVNSAESRQLSMGVEALGAAWSVPPPDLHSSLLETLVQTVDVRALRRDIGEAVKHASSVDLLRETISALDLAAAFLDVAIACTGALPTRRASLNLAEMLETTVRECASFARYRRVTILATIDDATAEVDRDMLSRALAVLIWHALGVMPEDATLQLDVSAGASVALDISFTGTFPTADPASPLAGLELVFVKDVLVAHGATIHVETHGGRTSIHVALPSSEDTESPHSQRM